MDTLLHFDKIYRIAQSAENFTFVKDLNESEIDKIKNQETNIIKLECELYDGKHGHGPFTLEPNPGLNTEGSPTDLTLLKKSQLNIKEKSGEIIHGNFQCGMDRDISASIYISDELFSQLWNGLAKYIETITIYVDFPNEHDFIPGPELTFVKEKHSYFIRNYDLGIAVKNNPE